MKRIRLYTIYNIVLYTVFCHYPWYIAYCRVQTTYCKVWMCCCHDYCTSRITYCMLHTTYLRMHITYHNTIKYYRLWIVDHRSHTTRTYVVYCIQYTRLYTLHNAWNCILYACILYCTSHIMKMNDALYTILNHVLYIITYCILRVACDMLHAMRYVCWQMHNAYCVLHVAYCELLHVIYCYIIYTMYRVSSCLVYYAFLCYTIVLLYILWYVINIRHYKIYIIWYAWLYKSSIIIIHMSYTMRYIS